MCHTEWEAYEDGVLYISTTVTVLQRYAYSFRLTDSFMALGITVSCSLFLFSSTLLWVKAWSDQVNFTTGSDGHLFSNAGMVQRKMTTCTSLLMKNKKSLRLEHYTNNSSPVIRDIKGGDVPS